MRQRQVQEGPPEAAEPSGAASCCLPSARAPSPANSTCSGFGPARPSAPTEACTGLTRLSAQRRVPAGLARWACPSTLTTCDLTEEPPMAPHDCQLRDGHSLRLRTEQIPEEGRSQESHGKTGPQCDTSDFWIKLFLKPATSEASSSFRQFPCFQPAGGG